MLEKEWIFFLGWCWEHFSFNAASHVELGKKNLWVFSCELPLNRVSPFSRFATA
jgi:hypothetical protein